MALLSRSSTNEPTLTPEWVLTWWQVFGGLDGRELKATLFREDGRLVGMAPLLKRRYLYPGRLPFQRLEPLGTGEDLEDEVCSDYANVISEKGAEDKVARALAQTLAIGKLGNWDELLLPMANGDAPCVQSLISAFVSQGFDTRADEAGASPYIPLPRTWEQYLEALSSNDRYYLARSMREFDKWAGGEVEVKYATSKSDLETGKKSLIKLHRERWSAEGKQGVFASSHFSAFHEALLPQLLDAGALELMWVSVRGAPIAALYNIAWNGKIYCYQSGRTLDVPRNVRPGVIAHVYAIRRAIETGKSEYDFMAGTSQFKRKLALAYKPLVRVRAVRKSLIEYVRVFAESLAATTRTLRKRPRAR
jgi:CelD/BcsL family acetyltransferase involved in cellulose biosynthesis